MEPERYGTYRVFEQLGTGGMATVHRAEQDTGRGVRHVALKRLNPTTERTPVNLFLDEARLLKYLHHPNIPEVYDSGRVFGTYFIAMEYVDGPDLKALLEHCSNSSVGPVPQAIVLNMMVQLLDALDHAHKMVDEKGRPLGIIHRDVTPSNLILDKAGVLHLVDFGLAKATLASEPSTSGIIKGKLAYIAPEYTRGQIDHRADLWAVGVVMYELLTARRLFDGAQAMDTIGRVRELPIPRPSVANPKIASEVDDIVKTALERDPRHRWPSAASMRDRIKVVAERLGEQCDNAKVIEWATWALDQQRGRKPQLTPMVAMPIAVAPIVHPEDVVRPPAYPAAPDTVWGPRTALILAALAVIVVIAIALRLAGK